MSTLLYAASYAARESTRHTYVAGRGFPLWAIVLIVLAVVLLIALAVGRPYGHYRSRRYIDTGPPAGGGAAPGGRTIVEEEDVF